MTKHQKTVAYHEAGHAVIARVLGVGVVCVSMFPTEPDTKAVATTQRGMARPRR